MIRMKGIRKEYRMGDSVLAALDGVDIHIKPAGGFWRRAA